MDNRFRLQRTVALFCSVQEQEEDDVDEEEETKSLMVEAWTAAAAGHVTKGWQRYRKEKMWTCQACNPGIEQCV